MTEKEQKNREKNRRANRTILWRSIFLMAVFGVVIFVPLLAKLWSIQITDHDTYKELAVKQQTRDLTVSADRGTIYDANGSVLAMSATAQTVVLSPLQVEQLQKDYADAVQTAKEGKGEYPDHPEPTDELIASELARLLDVKESTILDKLAKTQRQYEVVKSKVDEDVAQQVREFISEYKLAGGVFLQPDTKRYYPYSSLASHVVGWVQQSDNTGAYGLEALYEDELSGEAGRVVTAKNGKGTNMITHYENYIDAVDGSDLYLTLDAKIQSMLESALAEGIETFDVQYGGFAIAMDPNTGAILGMASSPEYDLNNPRTIADVTQAETLAEMKLTEAESDSLSLLQSLAAQEDASLSVSQQQTLEQLTEKNQAYLSALSTAQYEQWRSKALNDTYEPGSTFKSMVLAAALEEGVVTENSTFVCTGSYQVADRTIKCHKHEGHGTQTLAEAVENSCNPAFIQIGQKLGAEKFYDYLERYGMIGTTGIDIPGEGDNSALVWSRELFTSQEGVTSLATASFGQRFQVSPIQLITGIASVINGGHLYQPYVVESAIDNNGNVTYQHEVTEVRQVISASTSEIVKEILEGVVDGGTGKNAYVAGYRIGGKTGTSQTLAEDDHNIVSFVGFAPANDPQVIVLLAYDGPTPVTAGSNYTAGGYYISGGNMAAPMAGELIANILDYMGVERQYKPEELSGADTAVPKLTGHYLDYAKTLVSQAGLTCRTVGEGDVVTGQIPAAGAYIPGGSEVVLYLGYEEVPKDPVEVPELIGKSLEEVRSALANVGLYLRASGASDYYGSSYKAISQSSDAGIMVERGTVIDVRFADGSVQDYAAQTGW